MHWIPICGLFGQIDMLIPCFEVEISSMTKLFLNVIFFACILEYLPHDTWTPLLQDCENLIVDFCFITSILSQNVDVFDSCDCFYFIFKSLINDIKNQVHIYERNTYISKDKFSCYSIALYLHISKHFLRSFQIIVSKNHEYIQSYQFLKLPRPEINLGIFG